MNLFELKILDFIQSTFSCAFMDKVMVFVTAFGEAAPVIAVALVLLVFKKTRKIGLTAAIALIIGLIVANLLLKNTVARTRPFVLNDAVDLLIKPPVGYSFPSGHAIACAEVATAVFLYNKKCGVFVSIAAAVICFSRLYLYVHYPSDVLFGAAMGVVIGIFSKIIAEKIFEKLKVKKKE